MPVTMPLKCQRCNMQIYDKEGNRLYEQLGMGNNFVSYCNVCMAGMVVDGCVVISRWDGFKTIV